MHPDEAEQQDGEHDVQPSPRRHQAFEAAMEMELRAQPPELPDLGAEPPVFTPFEKQAFLFI